MTYKLVAFTPSTNTFLTKYINNQLLATTNLFPELEVEHVNELDERYYLYNKNINRFPCFIIFKDGARKVVLSAKVDDTYFLNWLTSNLG